MNWIKKLLGFRQPIIAVKAAAHNQIPSKFTNDELIARYGHLRRPALQLVSGEPGGFSRLGGLPQLPVHIEWPIWEDEPLSFLAQISLAEIHAALPSFLPSSGFLFFFYDQDQGTWGYDPTEVGGWRVLYATDDCYALPERAAPIALREEMIYSPTHVDLRRIESLPDSQRFPASLFDGSLDLEDAYSELRASEFGDLAHHQVLGYPTPVQNDNMEDECQLVSNGINLGGTEGYKDPRISALKSGAAAWKLLLQLDSDDEIGMMWGDLGTLYFWVREQDARAGDFSNVWMIFQCC